MLYIEHQALTQYLDMHFSLLHANNGTSHCGTVVHIPWSALVVASVVKAADIVIIYLLTY